MIGIVMRAEFETGTERSAFAGGCADACVEMPLLARPSRNRYRSQTPEHPYVLPT